MTDNGVPEILADIDELRKEADRLRRFSEELKKENNSLTEELDRANEALLASRREVNSLKSQVGFESAAREGHEARNRVLSMKATAMSAMVRAVLNELTDL